MASSVFLFCIRQLKILIPVSFHLILLIFDFQVNLHVRDGIRLRMSAPFFCPSFHFSMSQTLLRRPMLMPPSCIVNGKMEKMRSIWRLLSKFHYFRISIWFSRKQVDASKLEAQKDGVKVPETIEEYCIKSKPAKAPHDDVDMLDFDDNDYYDYGDDSG
jgi:hypothetical protein